MSSRNLCRQYAFMSHILYISNVTFIQHIPQDLQNALETMQPGYYSRDNATAWIQPHIFLPWLSKTMMGRVASQQDPPIARSMRTTTPQTRPTPSLHSRASSALSQTSSAYSQALSASSWSTPTHNTARKAQKGKSRQIDSLSPLVFDRSQQSKKRAIVVGSDDALLEISSDDDVELPRYILAPLKKRKLAVGQEHSKLTEIKIKQEIIKPKIKQEVSETKIKQEVGKTKIKQEVIEIDDSDTNDPNISVTRELKVHNLRTVTTPLKYWDVPRPGKSFATVLDVSAKPEGSYLDKKGDILSIAQIFRAYVC